MNNSTAYNCLLNVYMYLRENMGGSIKHVRITPDSYYKLLTELDMYEEHVDMYKYEMPPFDTIKGIPLAIKENGIDLEECAHYGTINGAKINEG